MSGLKKINCKHGLERRQEIEARLLRRRLEQDPVDEETFLKVKEYFKEYKKSGKQTFFDFLKKKDIVMYSAMLRLQSENHVKLMADLVMKK